MDLYTEVVFPDHAAEVLPERFEMPLFFIVGGADDDYLSGLVGQPIGPLVKQKAVNDLLDTTYVVYASRALLPTTGRAVIFPLSMLLNEKWPILIDIESNSIDSRSPTNVEMVWIIRALRRAGQPELAAQVRRNLLKRLYPESSDRVPRTLTLNSLSQLYLDLSEEQRKYPLIMLVDDLPFQLPMTIGEALQRISVTGCADTELDTLKTSLNLLRSQ